jgi:glyceraldehyde 3-phosphate dehydrogenase
MSAEISNKKLLGISGLGRIGKLTLWKHLTLNYFDGFVINIGREVGKSLEALIQTIDCDSTYGRLDSFLFGRSGKKCEISIINRDNNELEINGKYLKFLCKERNPKSINWGAEGVRLVVDCTGKFLDPTLPADCNGGSVRGHLEGGAEKVIISSPYKLKDATAAMPEDSSMFVYGINHNQFDKSKHHIISAASCTTTALAHMMKPLVETRETSNLMTASMSTIHAATNSQSILDSMPSAGAKDLRKTRSVMNNVIITSTGAAKALEKIMPEIQRIGFMADSVRIPTTTSSLITLNITISSDLDESGQPLVNRNFLNNLYKKYGEGPAKDLLILSERQNVSSDFAGYDAAVIIEGAETHTRTGFLSISAEALRKSGVRDAQDIQLPVTHAKIFGWYDNEYGSYVNCLSRLTVHIDKSMR